MNTAGSNETLKTTGDQLKKNPYMVNKLACHPDLIEKLRNGDNDTLVQVHLMPSNVCNQRCSFCSYRMPDNKNSSHFDYRQMLPIDSIRDLIRDMKRIGVKAVEVTGGGEPLAHTDKYAMFEELFNAGFDVGLVTNGTLLDDDLARLLAPNLTWLRVSIDASTPQTYSALRNAPERHFHAALDSLSKIRSVGNHKDEFRLGVGFVMANGNELDVYDLCAQVKQRGADNIRLSITFSDKHMDFFTDQQRVMRGIVLSQQAVDDLSDDTFQIINLIPERCTNILDHNNDYKYCYTKDLLCVVEGAGNVYTCCTFTGSRKGILGNFLTHDNGFYGVWEDSYRFRKSLNPKTYCNVTCLYAKRNLEMIRIVENDGQFDASQMPDAIHKNFI